MDPRKFSIPTVSRELGPPKHPLRISALAVIAAAVFLTACAGNPPNETMTQAESAVNEAAETKAAQFAALELRKARDHLDQAKQAMDDEDYEEAERLAEKAMVEAQLAEAKADAQSSQNAVAELRESLKALREEGQSQAR